MSETKDLTNELRDQVSCVAQGSHDWFRARLGYITSSNVHYVMKAGKATKVNPNPEVFSDTARRYFYQVAAERNLRESVIKDDEQFAEYLYRVELSNKAIRYGQETEDIARKVYSLTYNREVAQAGFILHPTIAHYGDSPDGVVIDAAGKPIGTIEIKCPNPDTFVRYAANIRSSEDLKIEKPEYYWQCQSHCECNQVDWCDFIFFDKMQRNGFVCIRINRNDEDIALMKERIILADAEIDKLSQINQLARTA